MEWAIWNITQLETLFILGSYDRQLSLIREASHVYRILVGKPLGKWPLRRLRNRLEDNIMMNCGEGG
jgi:hypothetical protein